MAPDRTSGRRYEPDLPRLGLRGGSASSRNEPEGYGDESGQPSRSGRQPRAPRSRRMATPAERRAGRRVPSSLTRRDSMRPTSTDQPTSSSSQVASSSRGASKTRTPLPTGSELFPPAPVSRTPAKRPQNVIELSSSPEEPDSEAEPSRPRVKRPKVSSMNPQRDRIPVTDLVARPDAALVPQSSI
ncbi:hypothetical protein ACHAP5_004919 [Fusarium lateritium]